jgi:hypothetical protein
MRAHAKMLPGAMYEKRASFLAIEIVLMAKVNLNVVSNGVTMVLCETYWYSWLALEAMDMNELVKTVTSSVLGGSALCCK